MSDVCGGPDPGGLGTCGLYDPHDRRHALLRADHDAAQPYRRIEWDETGRWERVTYKVGHGHGSRWKPAPVVEGDQP